MDALECIKSRRSIRKYLSKPVEWSKVVQIIDAGRFAPSAGNLQDWKFIVVIDKDKRRAIAEAALRQYWMESAPLHIVVCSLYEKSKEHYGVRGERLYSIQNCAAAIQNMLLAATALDLGSCWVSAFDEEKLKTALSIPGNVRPQAVLAFGYANESVPIPKRESLYVNCNIEKYGNRFESVDAIVGDYSNIIEKKVKSGLDFLKEKIRKKQ